MAMLTSMYARMSSHMFTFSHNKLYSRPTYRGNIKIVKNTEIKQLNVMKGLYVCVALTERVD